MGSRTEAARYLLSETGLAKHAFDDPDMPNFAATYDRYGPMFSHAEGHMFAAASAIYNGGMQVDLGGLMNWLDNGNWIRFLQALEMARPTERVT